jgi:heme-degrading monooxygenase HmoA
MYARIIKFKLRPGSRSKAEEIFAERGNALSAAEGMISTHFFGDDSTGEYGAIVLWQTQEDAEAFFKVSFPIAKKALEGLVEEPTQANLYEIIKVVEPSRVPA